jgi:hypothetical protein
MVLRLPRPPQYERRGGGNAVGEECAGDEGTVGEECWGYGVSDRASSGLTPHPSLSFILSHALSLTLSLSLPLSIYLSLSMCLCISTPKAFSFSPLLFSLAALHLPLPLALEIVSPPGPESTRGDGEAARGSAGDGRTLEARMGA